MQLNSILATVALGTLFPTAALAQSSFSGFTTYTDLFEGADNSKALTYNTPDRSTTLYVNVQILPNGTSHDALFMQFQQLCSTYGAHNISIIPRLRYGWPNGTVTAEPSDQAQIQSDVTYWADTLQGVIGNSTCQIPVVQAGTLGLWGEWHNGPFCSVAGQQSSDASRAVKLFVVNTLMGVNPRVAVRTPQDHALLRQNLTSDQPELFTMHDDCLMAEGTSGQDTGTFVEMDGQSADYWRNYTIQNAGNNGFGGEPCISTLPGAYDWSNWTNICSQGPEGMISYINKMKISYLNPLNPQGMSDLFHSTDPTWTACVSNIRNALLQYS